MKRRKVVSREYKVMLQAAKFAGSRKQLLTTARQLWDDFSRAIGPVVVAAGGTLETIEKERLIVFLDSDAQHLRAGGYIFRVRRPLESVQPQVTLKFRHPDRYVAESRQMKSRRIQTEIKFEEDIKPPFVSLYSFSTSGDIGKKPVPSTLDDVSRLFPDLSKRLGKVDDRHTLSHVNGFTARELVITGATMTIGTKPKVECECALIVWYDQNAAATAAASRSPWSSATDTATPRDATKARPRSARPTSSRRCSAS